MRYSHREGALGEMRDMVVPPPEEHEALSTESPVETGVVVPQHRKTRRRIVVASGVLAGNGVSISITPLGRRPALSSPSLLGHRRNGNHTLRNSPKIARDQEVGLARSSGVNRDRHVEEVSSLRCAM